jgi:phage-related protein
MGLGTALVVATGGLILIIPLIIGMVIGLKKMWKAGGLAKGIVLALGAAVLFALGPIAWIVAGAIGGFVLLKKNWSKVTGFFVKTGSVIKNSISAAFDGILSAFSRLMSGMKKLSVGMALTISYPFRAFHGAAVGSFNSLIKGANKLPLVNIPLIPNLSGAMAAGIPGLKDGTPNFEGGMAMVGEQGPELVSMPQGTSVTPSGGTESMGKDLAEINKNTKNMAKALLSSTIASANPLGMVGKALGVMPGGKAGGASQPIQLNVTLELDKRVLARHTEEIMVDRLNPATA